MATGFRGSQQQDRRAAIAWVRRRHDVDRDRLALWGNSLGGAQVISVVADDPRISPALDAARSSPRAAWAPR
jgi:dienelactone hydrolase